MKHHVSLLILLVGLAGLPAFKLFGQHPPNAEKAVQGVIEDLFEGLSILDTAKVRQACMPDIQLLESGAVWTIDSLTVRVLARKSRGGNFKRVNQFEFLQTRVSGKLAWVSYFNQATITYNDKTRVVKWLESVVLEQRKGQWRIAHLHSTELK